MSIWNEGFKILDKDGNIVSVQYPFSVDGDSVYAKDVDVNYSDIGNFSGAITDFFDSYRTAQTALSVAGGGANPKSFTVALKRPLATTTIILYSIDTTISNLKVTLKNNTGSVIRSLDFSANATKRSSQIVQFAQENLSEIFFEFYTDDEVNIDGVTIFKSSNVSIDAINGVISMSNSTHTPLLAGISFTGESIDTKNYGIVICSVYSDVGSATNGLSVEFSTDETNWYWTDTYTIEAVTGKTFSVQAQARYMRVVYTNGASDQTVFVLETTLKPVYIKPSSHRVADMISDQDDAELIKATLTGQDVVSNNFVNIGAIDGQVGHNLLVSVDQVESTTNSLKIIDYSHAELHNGDHYIKRSYEVLAKAGVKELLIVTPDTTRWCHMLIGIDNIDSSIVVEMFEGVTTSADGTLANSRNRNRTFTDNNTTLIYEDPTVTAGDTPANIIQDGYFGAGKNSGGGGVRDSEEVLLKQNTKYLIRITEQNIVATVINWSFDWYEHTNQ